MNVPDEDYPWWWWDAEMHLPMPCFGQMGLDSRKMKLRDRDFWPSHDYFCASEQLWACKVDLAEDLEAGRVERNGKA